MFHLGAKSLLENKNSYHSIALESQQDRDLMSFITPCGQFLYMVTPMGLRCSGDSITYRMDFLYQDTPQMKQIVDDMLLLDATLSTQFHQVWEALDLVSSNRAIFNSKKF